MEALQQVLTTILGVFNIIKEFFMELFGKKDEGNDDTTTGENANA